MDLHLDLQGSRVRAALESALREAVATGRLRPGTRLPSSRALAADLAIARNTVADAYGQLAAEGWLIARQGSGTRVAERASVTEADREPGQPAPRRPRYDLLPGAPDVASFPRSAWLTATRRALGDAPFEAFGYSDPRGLPELRQALAEYLARARGVRTSPARIVVCSGFTQGFWLLCHVLRDRGIRTLAVERYLQPRTRDAALKAGLRLHRLPVDEHGAVLGGLGDAGAVLLTAAHQFPLGVALSAARRAAVVQWALGTGGLIIEDDYDGEFRYDRHPLGSLQALGPEQVVYAGTASKAIAPGLRIGWLALPAHLLDEVVAAKDLMDRHSGAIDQLVLADFIRAGAYDRHVRRLRLAYRRRRDRLVAELGRDTGPAVRVSGIAAGLHALVELPPGVTEQEVIDDAAGRGLALDGLGTYADGAEHNQALVVGYARPPEHAFSTAVARLRAALASGGRGARAGA